MWWRNIVFSFLSCSLVIQFARLSFHHAIVYGLVRSNNICQRLTKVCCIRNLTKKHLLGFLWLQMSRIVEWHIYCFWYSDITECTSKRPYWKLGYEFHLDSWGVAVTRFLKWLLWSPSQNFDRDHFHLDIIKVKVSQGGW